MGLFKIFTSQPPTHPESEERPLEARPEREAKDTPTVRPPPPATHEPPRFDAVAVLETRGVGADQRSRVERTLELLKALPEETPTAVRKNIVEASLKAFDVSIAAIVNAASNEISAFEHFISNGHDALTRLTSDSERRIAELEAEIAKLRKRVEVATSDQAALDQSTLQEIERVRPILGFFGGPAPKVANDTNNGHPPTIIIDESLTRMG